MSDRLRWLTAICVVGLCAFAMTRGWSIVHFAGIRAEVVRGQTPANAVREWIGTPGLTSVALTAALSRAPEKPDRDAPRRRADDLTSLLAIRPLSSTDWLSLAGMRLVLGQSRDEVLTGLAMSSLTGPNEGVIMTQRAIFGLLQWESLPADAQRRTMADLAGAARDGAIGQGAMNIARNVLQAKSPELRSHVAGLLRENRVPALALEHLGL